MNRIFSIVWSRARGAWLVAGLFASAPALGQGLPAGGQVVAGSGSIGAAAGGKLVIDQASHRLAIDWRQFDIGADNTVQFNQPGRDAVALNRVLGPDASQIMGQLQANGRVFLINPNGVLFGQNAQVNVGGLVASTLDIGNADFMAGHYRFQGNGNPAPVVNRGRINAGDGGAVALLGGQVHNQGVIQARMGTVALAAGNAVTLDFAGDGLLNVQVDQAAKNALVDNGQLIQADGGQVLMTASASDALLQTVVNNTGVVEARTLQNRAGKIVLLGDFAGGTVKVDGKLDASAPDGGDGGFIDTSGAHVQIADGVKVTTLAPQGKTGTWLIDPTDFTIRAGNDPKTDSGIGADTLSTQLATTDISIETVDHGDEAGDIHVDGAVGWNAGTTLTLSAHRNINVNANITAIGDDAGLQLYAGEGSDGGDIAINSQVSIHGNNGSISLIANGDVSITGDMAVYGTEGSISLAGHGLSTGSDSTLTAIGNEASIIAMAQGDLSLGGDVQIDGDEGLITLIGGNLSIDSKVSIQGDSATMAFGACGGECGQMALNGEVAIEGDQGSIMMAAGGGISIAGDVSITGDDGAIALLGGGLTTEEGSSISIEGGQGAIALVACGDSECTDILGDEVIPANYDESSTFVPADGVISIGGNVSIDGNAGAIAMIGGDVSVDSPVSINGHDGTIAFVACRESGCGDILVNDAVSITGDRGNIFMMADDGIWTAGDISIAGQDGTITLLGGDLTIDSKVSITGDEAQIALSGNSLRINDRVTVAGGGFIDLETCSCNPSLGDIVINGDVSIDGEGVIDISSDGAIVLGAGLSAEAVFMEAEGDIVANGDGAITTPQLEVRSNDGAIALYQGVHQIDNLVASARSGLSLVNGKRLEVEEATVAGDGNILIRTTAGDLVLIPPFGPTMTAPPSGVVRVVGKGDIDLVSAGAFRNEMGADALQANDGSWRVWSQGPAQTNLDGLAYDFKQYNARYGSSAVLGQGNGVLYTLAPVLDVGLKGVVDKTYDGTDAAAITDSNYVLKAGLQDGDHVAFSKPAKGRYSDQNAAAGKTVTVDGLQILEAYEADSGAKIYGYRINASASADVGRIDRRAITISARDQGKVYGNADPSLSYTVGGQGLVAGDSLNGALARAGGENVGRYAIGLGSLGNDNYQVAEFSGAALSITPRSIMVTADDQRKYFGQADPALTWRITGGSLAFDDRLSGVLNRDPGEGLGAYAIRQGSLAAGANYVLDFVDGQLVVLPGTVDDYLGELAPAYHAATVSAHTMQQGPMAFDQHQGDGTAGPVSGGSQPQSLYHIENNGLRMPEGI
ncbi:filamentous hemagglutinin N-terminal domain-containing protein [Pusillimonas caeni]|uniref:two-partner secretion domain-containing protein n=1 Tax=Pusillimonas caeni TaxID=1348472 RepID=UPI000E5A0A41|nr:MBG domain-containing protein [Pusillimonas caeni]TFL11238.1 filamentous hemagglutinin N-terminal domain-containing protein [Pusillimonas caeni]